MKTRAVLIMALLAALMSVPIVTLAQSEKPRPSTPASEPADWREEFAYTLGVQAYIYAYPLVHMSDLRYDWVTNPKSSFYAALNHFHNLRTLANAKNYTTGGSPNQDTLYSWGWVDLRAGPVILSHPDMGERYFTFEIADYFSDNFAYVGTRTTGGSAGNFAILPPQWAGELPPGIKESFRSPTMFALIFGRTYVSGPQDVPAVNKLQDQYHLTPLSFWGKPRADVPENRDVWQPYARTGDPLADWRTINRAWAENPVDRDVALVKLFAQIGIGPSFTPESLDQLPEPTKHGLARAVVATDQIITEAMRTGAYKSTVVNGWNYPPKGFGRSGLIGDFITRAALQSRGGIIANDPEEAIYLNTFTDVEGKPLLGDKKYVVRFNGHHLPLVNYFWSMTVYKLDTNFINNPIDRYAIGDRSDFLKREADGSFSIYLQSQAPGGEQESNWLPTAVGEGFYLVLRTYGPKPDLLDRKWAPPAVRAVE